MTQQELTAHPRWRGFGDAAQWHPPLRGWLAVPLGYSERKWATEQPSETLKRRGLLKPDDVPGPASTPDAGQTTP